MGISGPFRILSRAAVRIDLAGGTLDLIPLCAMLEPPPITVNLAIRLYQVVEAESSPQWVFEDGSGTQSSYCGDLSGVSIPRHWTLVHRVVHSRGPYPEPLHLKIRSGVPAGSGLGGSSALVIGLLAVLDRAQSRPTVNRELVYRANHIETQFLQVPTGLQDYLPATYGGLNAWQWLWPGWRRIRLNRYSRWVARHCLLVYTGETRFSGSPNWTIFQRYIEGHSETLTAIRRIAAFSRAMLNAIVQRDTAGVADAMTGEMLARRRLSPSLVSMQLERLLSVDHPGILSMKVCGAGAGGCLLYWVKPEQREDLSRRFQEDGWTVFPTVEPAPALQVRARV